MKIALEDIRVIPFAPAENHHAASEVGVVVRQSGERLHVILCNIAENHGASPGDNILRVCMAVRDQVAPDRPLSTIDWHMVSGFEGSALHFRQAYHAAPLIASCNNDYAFFNNPGASYSLTRYPELIESYFAPGQHGKRHSPASSVFVPIDHAPGYIPMNTDRAQELEAGGAARMMMVDTAAFAQVWMKDLKKFDRRLYACADRDAAIEHLAQPYGNRNPFEYALRPAQVSFYDIGRRGSFGFENGHHRTLNLIMLKAPFMPMVVEADTFDAMKIFKEKFEYKAPAQSMAPPALLRPDFN